MIRLVGERVRTHPWRDRTAGNERDLVEGHAHGLPALSTPRCGAGHLRARVKEGWHRHVGGRRAKEAEQITHADGLVSCKRSEAVARNGDDGATERVTFSW